MLKKTFFLVLCLVLALSLFLPLTQGASPLSLGLDLAGGAMVTYRPDLERIPEPYADIPHPELLAMAKETLMGRLRQSFDTLPDVVISGDGNLIVSLPGSQDQRRILETVGETYRMTFRRALAVHPTKPATAQGLLLPYGGQWMDLGDELLSGEALDPRSIGVELATGGTLQDIGSGAGISFQFRPPYDDRFAEITRESIGGTLAILLDDQIEWAGRVEEEIRGPGTLSGGYTVEEATEVAAMLRSGNLPVSLEVESMSAVGPALGQEIFDRGRLALGWSVGSLMLLLLVAYGHRPALLLTGWVSLGTLLFFILGLISLFGLTVDLVAIAGLVLSVGMGMDAFILIFEAMENRRRGSTSGGRSPLSQLKAVYGFRGEGRTLVHANATTLLVVLLLFASDRLQSFALFLIVGLAASLLTIWVTRGLLERFSRRGWMETNPGSKKPWAGPLSFIRTARPGLFRFRNLYFAALAIFLLAAVVRLDPRRADDWLTLGDDFQPGMQMQIVLPVDQQIDAMVDDLRFTFPGVHVRHQVWNEASASQDLPGYLLTMEGREWESGTWRSDASGTEALQPGEATLTPAHLADWLEDRQVEVKKIHSIDARLSGRRMLTSLSVLVFSFLLLAFYLRSMQHRIDHWLTPSSRRQPVAAASSSAGTRIFVGTLLAVLIDVGVVLTSLALLGIPIGMPVVAALLTIVGYSVNDSMVLWSHLSQPTAADSSLSLRERVTEGVDRILSRTLLTSLSTMVPAIAILVVGIQPLTGFASAVLVGTVAGTLSSMFVVASFAARDERVGDKFADAVVTPRASV